MGDIRIIAGEGRGRVIKSLPDNFPVRPILARIKKSLFDILKNKLEGSSFLDLFAGCGAVGIEAISRGAKNVVFLDLDSKCLGAITANLKKLKWENRAVVNKADVTKNLSWLNNRFDIVFMGPPYKDENKKPLSLTGVTIERIKEAKILADDGIIVAQHHKKEFFDVPLGYVLFRQENYGDTVVSFLRYK